MYLKFIRIKNQGPIEELKINLIGEDGIIKPILIVGENGSGKTTLLSSIVDSFYLMAGECFKNIYKTDERGNKKLYKVIGISNLKSGKKFEFAEIRYSNEIEYIEYYKNENSKDATSFENKYLVNKFNKEIFKKIPTFLKQIRPKLDEDKIKNELKNKVHFYLPAYRYEEPFWKTKEYHNYTTKDKKTFDNNYYNKEIEILSSFEKNKEFVFEMFFEIYKTNNEIPIIENILLYIKEHKNEEGINDIVKKIKNIVAHYSIQTNIYLNIQSIIKKIKQNNNAKIEILHRSNKERIVVGDGEHKIPLSSFSLGEMNLFNIFVNILRHADNVNLKNEDIEGIVVIDEIESHLHTKFQTKILPDLIELFPKIQFIITTHSPMFILGMKEKFGEDGFDIFEMPTGKKIPAEKFSEFKEAYEIFNLENSIIPMVYVEGKTDIDYLKIAFRYFGGKFPKKNIRAVGGKDNLISLKTHIYNYLPEKNEKVLMIFDCDVKGIENKTMKNITYYKLTRIEDSFIKDGIENLFPNELMNEITEKYPDYIDIIEEHKETRDGKEIIIPKKYEIRGRNKNDILYKELLCEEICKNHKSEKNFANFKEIVEKIEEFLKNNNSNAN